MAICIMLSEPMPETLLIRFPHVDADVLAPDSIDPVGIVRSAFNAAQVKSYSIHNSKSAKARTARFSRQSFC